MYILSDTHKAYASQIEFMVQKTLVSGLWAMFLNSNDGLMAVRLMEDNISSIYFRLNCYNCSKGDTLVLLRLKFGDKNISHN